MKLALFFTRGVSLKLWLEMGLFDREKLLYEEHLRQNKLEKVYWFTYGLNDDRIEMSLKKANQLHNNIEIVPMPRWFSFNKKLSWLYSFLLPFLKRDKLREVDIIKTNQMDGSWSAIIAKWLYKKPLLLRTGYTKSVVLKKQCCSKTKLLFYEYVEKIAYEKCDCGVVGSRHDKEYVSKKYGIEENKIEVLYNFVDINKFCPKNTSKYEDRIVFIGRLHPEKNLNNLIKAISKTELTIDIFGDGPIKEDLATLANRTDAKVNFLGIVPNNELPDILNKYLYFVLPSFYEGMPKALLEAMACGLVCIGTNVKGINEVIEDGKNGFLIDSTEPDAIKKAIDRAKGLNNHQILSMNARDKIVDLFSLQRIANEEQKIIERVMSKIRKQ
jgi:glycosyltransferase involved in cell wall biosynthesis